MATALARDALTIVVPDEMEVFDDVAAEYWSDPPAALQEAQREDAVGYGFELILLTPMALAVATAVVRFAAGAVAQATPDARLDRSQLRQARRIAHEQAIEVGVEPRRADALADALTGALARTA